MTGRHQIQQRLVELTQRIDAARVDDREITLVAVTKAFGPELIDEAVAAGLSDFGENYAQELEAKVHHLGWPSTARPAVPRFHFIGGLQRNKIKRIAPWIHLWQSVDRESLIDELAKRAPGASILIQMNTTGETSKAGCEPALVDQLVERADAAGLAVRGLMAVGPTDPGADPRPGFASLRATVDRLGLAEASMGMSGDFELAVAEGATMVRLGSALFGARPTRPEPSPPAAGVGK